MCCSMCCSVRCNMCCSLCCSVLHLHCVVLTGWLWLVGSLKLQVSFAKESHKRDYILQKRPIILRSLLIVATPYTTSLCHGRSVFKKKKIYYSSWKNTDGIFMFHFAFIYLPRKCGANSCSLLSHGQSACYFQFSIMYCQVCMNTDCIFVFHFPFFILSCE